MQIQIQIQIPDKLRLFALIGLLIVSPYGLSDEQTKLKPFVLATHAPDSTPHGEWAKQIYTEALASLGYGLTIRRCMPHVCTRLANSGQVDGELIRVSVYEQQVPSLIRLTEPTFYASWAAFTLGENDPVESWEQVFNSDLTISYMVGLPYLDQRLRGKLPDHRLIKIKHWKSGLPSLVSGKADVYISADNISNDNESRKLHRTTLFSDIPLYLFLHQRHEKLIPKLSEIVVQMRKNSDIEKIYREIVR